MLFNILVAKSLSNVSKEVSPLIVSLASGAGSHKYGCVLTKVDNQFGKTLPEVGLGLIIWNNGLSTKCPLIVAAL